MKNVKATTGLTPGDEGIVAAFLDAHAAKAIEHLKVVQQAEVRDGMKWTEAEAYEAAFDYLSEQWMQDPGMPDPGESLEESSDWDESAQMFDGAVQEVLKRFKANGGLFETMEFKPAHRAIRYSARLKAKLASRVKASLALKSDNDLISDIIAYEQGDLDEDAMIALFQQLVDSGMAWSLQGHYGRTAKHLIEQGLVTVKASRKIRAEDMTSEESICPVCESDDMDLGDISLDNEGAFARRSFHCSNCGSKGNEVYEIAYMTTEVDKKGTPPDEEGIEGSKVKAYPSIPTDRFIIAVTYREAGSNDPMTTYWIGSHADSYYPVDKYNPDEVGLNYAFEKERAHKFLSKEQAQEWLKEVEPSLKADGYEGTGSIERFGGPRGVDGGLMVVNNMGFKPVASLGMFKAFQARLKARTGLSAADAKIPTPVHYAIAVAPKGIDAWIGSFIKANGLNDLSPRAAMELLPKSILALIPPIDSTSDKEAEEVLVPLKLFNPGGAGSWFITELNPSTGEAFGYVTGLGTDELGYIDINELKSYRGPMGLGIERDSSWNPSTTLEEVMSGVKASKKASARYPRAKSKIKASMVVSIVKQEDGTFAILDMNSGGDKLEVRDSEEDATDYAEAQGWKIQGGAWRRQRNVIMALVIR